MEQQNTNRQYLASLVGKYNENKIVYDFFDEIHITSVDSIVAGSWIWHDKWLVKSDEYLADIGRNAVAKRQTHKR